MFRYMGGALIGVAVFMMVFAFLFRETIWSEPTCLADDRVQNIGYWCSKHADPEKWYPSDVIVHSKQMYESAVGMTIVFLVGVIVYGISFCFCCRSNNKYENMRPVGALKFDFSKKKDREAFSLYLATVRVQAYLESTPRIKLGFIDNFDTDVQKLCEEAGATATVDDHGLVTLEFETE